MAIALAFSPAVPLVNKPCTVNLTGATASTRYVIIFNEPDHPGDDTYTTVTTDGAGAASAVFPVQGPPGAITTKVRPESEYLGTTTAAATASATSVNAGAPGA